MIPSHEHLWGASDIGSNGVQGQMVLSLWGPQTSRRVWKRETPLCRLQQVGPGSLGRAYPTGMQSLKVTGKGQTQLGHCPLRFPWNFFFFSKNT